MNKKYYNKDFYRKEVLTKITSKIKTYDIAGFDVETHGYKNNYYLGGVYLDKYYSFLDKYDLIAFIEEKSTKNLYFVATNLGFDFQAVYYNTIQWNEFKLIIKNGHTITAKRGKTRFSDTMNYSQSSVQKLGKMIGIEKIHYKKFLGKIPRTQNQLKKLKDYNSQDCLISKRAIELFQEIFNKLGCELKLTISSTALDLYRRKYMPFNIYKEPIKMVDKNTTLKDFIMSGYYGGRVETFKRGKLKEKSYNWNSNKNSKNKKYKKYYWLDYNSAYPNQMLKEYPLPSSCKLTYSATIETIKKYHGVSEVDISCPYMYYPLLPLRQDGKLIFPYGNWKHAVYNHIELRAFLNLNPQCRITKIHKTIYYTKTFYPFKKYITTLYGLRLLAKKNNEIVMSEVYKILMNGLYGKLATKDNQDIEFFDFETMTDEQIKQDDKKGRFDNMNVTHNKGSKITRGYSEHTVTADQNFILPILSSCVTSYQRVQLHKDLVRLKGLYCDTDSILTDQKHEDNIELGGLKLEKLVKAGYLIRPKCYMIYDELTSKWNIKVKGINKMTSEKFYDIMSKKTIGQTKFMKIKEALKRNYTPNQRKKFTKLQSIEDNKRDWAQPFNKDILQDSKPIYVNE